MIKAALYYLDKLRYSVIPVGIDKKPIVEWKIYQERYPYHKEIKDWWEQTPNANIGIVTGRLSNLAVIDIDDMEIGKGNIEDIIGPIEELQTPICKTPKGLHIYFKYPDGVEINNNARLIEGCDFRGNGGYVVAPPSRSLKKVDYKWIKRPDKVDTLMLPDSYIARVRDILYTPEIHSTKEMFIQGSRDNDIFHTAYILAKSGAAPEEIRQIVHAVAKGCNPPFPPSETDRKITSALERAYRKERNIAEEIRQFVETTDGYFSLNELSNFVVCATPQDKTALRVAVHRLCKDGLLERTSSGNYRKIHKDLQPLDITGEIEPPLEIVYPFGIEKFINTYKKNIIITAGSQNAGKSCFMLNFAKLNMYKHKVLYFSSEMGVNELKTRIYNFKDIKPTDWKVSFYERSRDFADVIDPNAINIIDYMEIHQEHFLMGKWIKDIFDKLKDGIALIAIQKKYGSNMGVGGHATLEKPRLYLTVENGIVKLEKAKNWAEGTYNPNGLSLCFKVIYGSEFIITKGWHRYEEEAEEGQLQSA